MLDNFMESQYLAYTLLTNSIRNNKLSHAYLIDGNGNEDAFDFVMGLVKMIVCDRHNSNCNNCGDCNKCSRIDDGNYTELKIIETDGSIIKKDQLLELQSEFSKAGIEDNKRIYIIKDCDKMNKQASNCLLKFLEEPEEGIIAILFTNHMNNVISTIISRCQIIKLVKNRIKNEDRAIINLANNYCNSINDVKEFIEDEKNVKIVDNIIKFIDYYEDNGLDILLYLKKMWYNNFLTREDSGMAIYLMINFYYDVLKKMYGIDDYFFSDYLDYIEKVKSLNSVESLIKKIDVCIDARENIKYNLNLNLLIDDMVIKLGE